MRKTHHDNVISKAGLDLDELWTGCRAWFKSKSNLFKLGVQTALGLPTQ